MRTGNLILEILEIEIDSKTGNSDSHIPDTTILILIPLIPSSSRCHFHSMDGVDQ